MFIELLFSEQELKKKAERALRELGIDNPQELREGKIKIRIKLGKDGKPSRVEVIRKASEKEQTNQ